jgi:hypothetical protein
MKLKHLSTALGSSLLFLAGVASAQTAGTSGYIDSHPGGTGDPLRGHIVGSDTLNELMDDLIEDMILDGVLSNSTTPGNEGYRVYDGLGSSVGQRWAEGSPNLAAGEPDCTPTDGNGGNENNPGCQEIIPMSRMLNSSICDDDLEDGSQTGSAAAGAPNHNYRAEGMAVCMDGIVVITNNATLGEYGDDASACSTFAGLSNTDNTGNTFVDNGVGNLRDTGTVTLTSGTYTIGGGTLGAGNEWKDVLRLVYTGCDNDDGLCAGADNRVTRCGSEVRRKVMEEMSNLFEGTDCAAGGCSNGTADGGLRQVYRRDDGSGTSGTFLELLSIDKNPANLQGRGRVVNGTGGTITPMTTIQSFCDGGQLEGFFPTNFDGSGNAKFDNGDPIRKPCKAEDDLCAYDGRMPVVRAIRSTVTPGPSDTFSAYPQFQCSKNKFARKAYISSSLKVCPDNTVPGLGGTCKFPYYEVPVTLEKNFDCLNQVGSRPSTVPISTDGRAYNFVVHQDDGTVVLISGSGASALPEVASWRQNMAQLITVPAANNGFAFGPSALGDFQCTEDDATRNIGCIVSKTTCTFGFAGREAAYFSGNNNHLTQEPVLVKDAAVDDTTVLAGTYKFSRKLFLNAIGGFENLSADCTNRGGTVNECADELDIANEFYNYGAVGNRIAPLCTASGFIPMPAMECIGAMHSSATNNACGATATQAPSACQPL